MAVSRSVKRAVAWGLWRSGALSLHRSGFERGRAILLFYHRVNDERDPFFPATPVKRFTDQLDYLARRYSIEPLESVLDWLDRGAPGRPRIAVTIDDGYPDTHDVLLPLLERHGVPATLFLSTSPPETGEVLWTDRTRALFKHTRATSLDVPALGRQWAVDTREARLRALADALALMKRCPPARLALVLAEIQERLGAAPKASVLGWDHVLRLVRGPVSLGAHTHFHFVLSQLAEGEVGDEIETSVRLIRERAGIAVTSFAYPNGEPEDYDGRAIEVLRRLGLRSAVTCRFAFARPGQERFELPRIPGNEPSLPLFAARLAGLSPGIRRASA